MIKKVIFLGTLSGILLVNSLWAIDEYPSWFLYPKKYPTIVTGYTYGGHSAYEDATRMYCAYKSCVVKGTLEIFQNSEDDQWLKNSDYYYYYSQDTLQKIRGQLAGIDSFLTNVLDNEYIGAYSFNPKDSIEYEWLAARELTVPNWTQETFWEDDNYYYGVGLFDAQKNENDAWKTAEEQAIFTILNNVAVGYYRLVLQFNDPSQANASRQEITFIRIKFYLRNIEILERFPNLAERNFYVLVRIAKKDVISPMLKR